MKPYQQIAIAECKEPLIPIPLENFAVESPHPYQKLGANYNGHSPYYLRQSVFEALVKAQAILQNRYLDWHIKIFDAYRPIEVQQFMVDYTFASVLRDRDLDLEQLSPQQQQKIWSEVYQFWAVPSDDPKTPPPHSTGAAIDLTLVNADEVTLDLGSKIDEISERSHPDYYANSNSDRERTYHQRRRLLREIMESVGFCCHPHEWWHFSLGDQMWAWLNQQKNPQKSIVARYGRV
jgi:D-alanyl-D-alanine dipeptidase